MLSAGAVEARRISSGGVRIWTGGISGWAMRSSSKRAASRPMRSCEMRIVVSGGCTMSTNGISLWPVIETSSGQHSPRADSARTTPSASRSLAAAIAVKPRRDEQPLRGGLPSLARISGGRNNGPRSQSGLQHRAPEPLGAQLARGDVLRTGEMADVAVSEAYQVQHGEAHPLAIIGSHSGQAPVRVGAVDQHGRQAELDTAGKHRIPRVRRREDQALRPTGDQAFDQFQRAGVARKRWRRAGRSDVGPAPPRPRRVSGRTRGWPSPATARRQAGFGWSAERPRADRAGSRGARRFRLCGRRHRARSGRRFQD